MDSPSLLLDDYLDRPDFAESFLVLTGELSSKLKLPNKIDELGLVCQNVKKAAAYLEKKYGMKPFFLANGSPKKFSEFGKEVPFTTRLAFGFYKGVIIEIAEPGLGSNIFAQTEATDDRIMINHLGFLARDMELTRGEGDKKVSHSEIMKNAGIPKFVEGVISVFGFIAHIHIFETMHLTSGVEIEFLDFRLFGVNGAKINFPPGLINFVGWLQEKTGFRVLTLKEDQTLPPERG